MKYLLIALWGLMLAATSASAQNDYRIKGGDTLSIEVLEDTSLNRSLLVLPDGTINFPFAGTVQAGGRTAAQVQQAIASSISSNFTTTPTVFVSVASVFQAPLSAGVGSGAATMDIYFIGEVNQPGLRPMERGTTFLQAVAQSGGFTKFAATKRVQLRRFDRKTGKQSVYSMNFKALADGGNLTNDIVLQDGDVILVPERRLFE
ncbi:polysaccharide export protein [Roseobacter sp. YSTF-M11]|uniref:Polysaccharide export protein n=1 Tax=Roseobacter insulae TaxID=2859783 RepID=A0A9X1G1C1_9RHOB|nr:polysaccharide biosynthesis/export family protein [Roseobacter insulae]MBW4710768.1 polysaccharide export protein [Roseobacter insulae]